MHVTANDFVKKITLFTYKCENYHVFLENRINNYTWNEKCGLTKNLSNTDTCMDFVSNKMYNTLFLSTQSLGQ